MAKSKIKKNLTKKEIAFCRQYIETGNAKEAAKIAGYKINPQKKAAAFLSNDAIIKTMEKMFKEKKKNLACKALLGYERLAFGSISDCVKLLFADNLKPNEFSKMNLFNVSSIKKSKDGGMEIKFFDRLQALQKLEENIDEQKEDNEPFYYTLEKSIKNLELSKKAQAEK